MFGVLTLIAQVMFGILTLISEYAKHYLSYESKLYQTLPEL
jgi:hypothetical protein